MRQLLSVVVAGSLGGCSLIYNPSNLPAAPGEAGVMIDAEIILDADPSKLSIDPVVTPASVDEGAGADGSRSAVLVITGMQIIPGATVSVARNGGGATTATVDNTNIAIADDGDMISVPIAIAVDPALSGTQSYMLDVTVSNPGGFSKTVPSAVKVQGYDELTASSVASGVHRYSRVDIAGMLSAADSAMPLVIRSNSSITIGAASSMNGATGTPGPGGGAGGPASTDGSGPAPGKHNGGGGGFATAGSAGTNGGSGAGGAGNIGDVAIKSLTANRGSGGAGGGALTGGTPGTGGGGGGTVELTALGMLTIAGVTANGGLGTAGTGGVTTPTDGGGGSGGAILIRAGGASTLTGTYTATGGTPGGVATAGKGGDGRLRFDLAANGAPTATPAAYHGPMFVSDTPLITRDVGPMISITCQAGGHFGYFLLDKDSSLQDGGTQPCGPMGTESINLGVKGTVLNRGMNQMCLYVDGVTQPDPNDPNVEDRNCITIVYVFKT